MASRYDQLPYTPTGASEPFRRISIRGLFGVGNFELDFNNQFVLNNRGGWDIGSDLDNLKIIYGLNGSGKTTVLRIIKMLLEGDIAGLLTIPFESIEIDRWEAWDPPITHEIPGFPKGFQLWGMLFDPTFEESYNHLKILTQDFHDDWGPGNPHVKAGSIDDLNKEILDKFLKLPNNLNLSNRISEMSEYGAYELSLCNEHIHRLNITTGIGENNAIKIEYTQDRNHRRNDDEFNIEPILNLFKIEQKFITPIVGKEVIAEAELNEVTSGERFRSFLNKEESTFDLNAITYGDDDYLHLGYLNRLNKNQILELEYKGIIDISQLKDVWKAYNGFRKHWDSGSSIRNFDEKMKSQKEYYSIQWDNEFTSNPENPLVSIIPYYKQDNNQDSIYDLNELSQPSVWVSSYLNQDFLIDEKIWINTMEALENYSESTELKDFEIKSFINGCIFIEDFILGNCVKDLYDNLSFHNNSRIKINEIYINASFKLQKRIEESLEIDVENMGRINFPFLASINKDFLKNKKLVISNSWGVIVENNGIQIPYEKLSHGESRLLQILWTIGKDTFSGSVSFSKHRRWKTVLIDEPEVGLHIDWQRKLTMAIKGFYNLSAASNQIDPVNVILCTHSPEIVASAPEDSISIEPISIGE